MTTTYRSLPPYQKKQVRPVDRRHALELAHQSKVTEHTVLASAPSLTPSLCFSHRSFRARQKKLKALCQHFDIDLFVAMKACSEQPLLTTLSPDLDGFDVSNLAEYNRLPTSLRGKTVSLTAPLLPSDLAYFQSKSNALFIVLDSLVQWHDFMARGIKLPYLLRLQGSDFIPSDDTGHYRGSRFGLTRKELAHILADPQSTTHKPIGFHVHHGSERNRTSTYIALLRAMREWGQKLPSPPTMINLGGGWHRLTLTDFEHVFLEARACFPRRCRVAIEPGKWYAQDQIFAQGTIVNQRQDQDFLHLTLDLSAECHLRWSNPDLLVPQCHQATQVQPVMLWGATCYERDRIGRYLVPFHKDFAAETGLVPQRRLWLAQVSAYALSWNHSFNGVPRAHIIELS